MEHSFYYLYDTLEKIIQPAYSNYLIDEALQVKNVNYYQLFIIIAICMLLIYLICSYGCFKKKSSVQDKSYDSDDSSEGSDSGKATTNPTKQKIGRDEFGRSRRLNNRKRRKST